MEAQTMGSNQPLSYHGPVPVEGRTVTEAQLVEVVRQLGPFIREHAAEAERERRLTRQVIEAMSGAGLFRLYIPRSLNGYEVDPATYSRVVEEVSRYDSAAGWFMQAGNTGAWWAAALPNEGAEEVYGLGQDTIQAAALHPPLRAVEVDGGYLVTGRAPLASGVHDSNWLGLSAMVMEGDRPKMNGNMPDIISVILHTHEAEIIDNWHSLGLRGSDSCDVAVSEVFVPMRRVFRFAPDFERGPHYSGPLYQFPGIGQVATIAVPVALGIAREAIDTFMELAKGKTPFGTMKKLADKASVQASIGRAEAIVRSARLFYYETLRGAWDRVLAGQSFNLSDRADLLLAGTHAMSSAVKATEMMFKQAGTSGIYASNPLERYFRDTQTIRHHGFVSEARYETAGQVYLDRQPEFFMVNL